MSNSRDPRRHVQWLIKGLGAGGSENLLLAHARVADHDRFRYTARYLIPAKDHLVPELEAAGVPCRCIGTGSNTDLRWLRVLHRDALEDPPDVVHFHSPLVAAEARPVIRRLRPRPLVMYTEHTVWSAYNPLTRAANLLTYGMDDVKLAVSWDTWSSVPWFIRSNLQPLAHGIDQRRMDEYRNDPSVRLRARHFLGVNADDLVIGTVANLRPDKDAATLMQTAALVVREVPRATFTWVGQGRPDANLRALHRRLGLGDRFRFVGMHAEGAQAICGFDVFALSSVHEGLPVALMEAMSLGVPCAATAVGGIVDTIRPGVDGLLCPAGAPEKLADNLLVMATDDELRQQLGAQARSRSAMFDASRAVRTIEALYEGARPGRPAPRVPSGFPTDPGAGMSGLLNRRRGGPRLGPAGSDWDHRAD